MYGNESFTASQKLPLPSFCLVEFQLYRWLDDWERWTEHHEVIAFCLSQYTSSLICTVGLVL